ncbi:MAG TPA: hypothetical protein VGI39_19530 [Polyangiaceae bacterium]|jgi:hypothetical protein
MKRVWGPLWVLALPVSGACSGSGGAPFVEAKHTPLPVLLDQGGPVLTAPEVVTITFPNDPYVSTLEAFGATATNNAWWDAVRAGYCETGSKTACVGDGPPGTSVRIPTAPGDSYEDTNDGSPSTLQAYIASLLTSGALPAPTAQSILLFYFPGTTALAFQGLANCTDFGGYHNSMTYQGAPLAFVVVSECLAPEGSDLSETGHLTFGASHEIIEASTDPFITATTAGFYLNFDDPTILAWNDLAGGEVADMCQDLTQLHQDEASEGGFSVQRSWSNTEAAAGHDPCVPSSGHSYFNVAPTKKGEILQVDVGKTATFEADAFSDAPVSDWFVQGIDTHGSASNPSPYLTVQINGAAQTSTNNGAKITVSVTLNQDPAPLAASTGFAGATAVLASYDSATPAQAKAAHVWPFLVTTPAAAQAAGLPPQTN